MSAERPRRRAAGTIRLVVGTALVVQVLAWSATQATAASHAKKATTTTMPGPVKTSTTTTTTLPPAPAWFSAELVNTYQAELSTARALGKTSGFESLAQYKRQVANLNAPALATFFHVTQHVPHWNEVPALMQTIAAGARLPAASSSSSVAPGPASAAGSGGASVGLSSFIRPSTTAAVLAALHNQLAALHNQNAILVGTPVGPFTAEPCPTAPSEASIFAAQIVIDVASALFNGLVAASNISEFVSNFAAIFLGAIVAVTVYLVALIVHDTLVYEEDLAVDCANENLAGQVANIDNTTIQSYSLLTNMMQLVVQSQSTESTTEQDVVNLQNELGTVQQTLTEALTTSTQTVQSALGGDNQSQNTEMLVIQSALQKDLTTIQALQTTTGNEVVSGDTTIESSIVADQTQVIHEIDSDSQGITTLLTQYNQQITNALQSNFAMTQQQYENNLQVEIEQGLAGWAPVVPEVELMTPASNGGLLNATPVGVQEVVTSDIQGLQAIGVKVKSLAVTDLAAGNAALAAKQYYTAWTDYQIAYQAAA